MLYNMVCSTPEPRRLSGRRRFLDEPGCGFVALSLLLRGFSPFGAYNHLPACCDDVEQEETVALYNVHFSRELI